MILYFVDDFCLAFGLLNVQFGSVWIVPRAVVMRAEVAVFVNLFM